MKYLILKLYLIYKFYNNANREDNTRNFVEIIYIDTTVETLSVEIKRNLDFLFFHNCTANLSYLS